ncbi:MAG: hydroxymethylbilane synthase [Caulobacteraceae bacterium]|nr:hydroxymethylbilane synthase [Caulobacteraceae bacterium]
MAKQPLVRIGTRASKLALTQSGMMQRKIAVALGYSEDEADAVAPLVEIITSGDRIQDRRLLEAGGKGLFTKEIEEALLDGRIDVAIHSLKDVPSIMPGGLVIAALPEREDPRDAFVSVRHASFEDLPQGAVLGTASLRRQTQSLFVRPDLDVQVMRGNVDTRIAKLERGEADAILLAYSGLKRLGLGHVPRQLLDPVERPPAPGQGCLAIQTREHDAGADWVTKLRHHPTAIVIAAERGALEALEGSCRTAIGAHARLVADDLDLVVEALTPDGKARFRREASVRITGEGPARALGLELGRSILEEGGERLFLPT